MRRLSLSPVRLVAMACVLACALGGGCGSASLPSSTAGENRIRTDGVYECRDVDVRDLASFPPSNPSK